MARQEKVMLKKVIVVSPHPDDETLGCAGTLLRHKACGDKIYWLIATSPKKEYGYSKAIISREEKQIAAAAKIYNFDRVYKLGLPPARLEQIPAREIIEKISLIFKEAQPEIVYLPFLNDVHSDHRIIFNASFSFMKSFRSPFIKKVLMMEILSETEFAPHLKGSVFIPHYFVDITGFLHKKIKIMRIFESEMSNHPFPRSVTGIRALATIRGVQANCQYAESFMLLKEVWKK